MDCTPPAISFRDVSINANFMMSYLVYWKCFGVSNHIAYLSHNPDVSVSDDGLLALLGLGAGSLGQPAQGQNETQEHLVNK